LLELSAIASCHNRQQLPSSCPTTCWAAGPGGAGPEQQQAERHAAPGLGRQRQPAGPLLACPLIACPCLLYSPEVDAAPSNARHTINATPPCCRSSQSHSSLDPPAPPSCAVWLVDTQQQIHLSSPPSHSPQIPPPAPTLSRVSPTACAGHAPEQQPADRQPARRLGSRDGGAQPAGAGAAGQPAVRCGLTPAGRGQSFFWGGGCAPLCKTGTFSSAPGSCLDP